MDDVWVDEGKVLGNFEDYVIAICQCPLPFPAGIMIPKSFKNDNGWYSFKCTKCGLEGQVYGGSKPIPVF